MHIVMEDLFSLLYRIFILCECATIILTCFAPDGGVSSLGLLKIVLLREISGGDGYLGYSDGFTDTCIYPNSSNNVH